MFIFVVNLQKVTHCSLLKSFIEIICLRNHMTSFFGRQHLFGNQLSLFTNLCLIIEVPFWKRQHLFANQLSLRSGLVNMARINKLGTMKLLPCEIFNGGAEIRFESFGWWLAACNRIKFRNGNGERQRQ